MTMQNRPAPVGYAILQALTLLFALPVTAAQAGGFATFESGQVRPVAMTPDGQRLLVTNTPDNRLEVFLVTDDGLVHEDSVPVGLEPVARPLPRAGIPGGGRSPASHDAAGARHRVVRDCTR